MTSVLCVGECMLELRHVDEKTLRLGYAGDTYNTAVYLRRVARELDIPVTVGYLTGVGGDAHSAAMRTEWVSEGLVDHSVVIDGKRPGLYTIRVGEHGERQFDYWRSDSAARNLLSGTDWVDLLDADVVYLSGITLQMTSAAGRVALDDRLERLRGRGRTIVLDTNYRPDCWPSARTAADAMDSVAAHANVVLATLDDESALHGPMTPAEAAGRISALGPAEVVVKVGSAGAWLQSDDGLTHIAPVATRVLDTTAAGDSFAAGYLAGRIAGEPPPAAAALGAEVAAVVISRPGAITPAGLRLTPQSRNYRELQRATEGT